MIKDKVENANSRYAVSRVCIFHFVFLLVGLNIIVVHAYII